MPKGRGKRSGGPWYGEFRERLRFEAGARSIIPDLKQGFAQQVEGAGCRLYFTVDVPHYGRRKGRRSLYEDGAEMGTGVRRWPEGFTSQV